MEKLVFRILLIEDNPGDARLIQEFLKEINSSADYELTSELKWIERISELENLSNTEFDVIISDLSLPDSQRLETVERVCSFCREIPVIFLTGTEDEEIALKALKMGAQDYLVKGKIDAETLYKTIKYAVERKKQELKYIKQKKKLEETLDILRTVNDILRHDILNNLTTAEIAIQSMNSENSNMARIAAKSIKKSINLIKQMKELDYLNAKDEKLKKCDLRGIIEDVIEHYNSVHFTVQGNCNVLADEALNSVIDNIIGNAIIHGKTERIDIKIENKGEWCEIRIADYGVGIPDEIKNKLFERGFKYGESGQSGLGLYIAKKVVERYGGEINIEDNVPSGAVFIIKLKHSEPLEVSEHETS